MADSKTKSKPTSTGSKVHTLAAASSDITVGIPVIAESIMKLASEGPDLRPQEIAERVRGMKLEKYAERELKAEIRVATAEYAAHLSKMSQQLARLRRILAILITCSALLVIAGAVQLRLYQGDKTALLLIMAGPLGAALSVIYYFIEKSRIQSRTMSDVTMLQIVASLVQSEIARRSPNAAEKSSA